MFSYGIHILLLVTSILPASFGLILPRDPSQNQNPKVFCNVFLRPELSLPKEEILKHAENYCSALQQSNTVPPKSFIHFPMKYPTTSGNAVGKPIGLKFYLANADTKSSWTLSKDDCSNMARDLVESCESNNPGYSPAGQIHVDVPAVKGSPPPRVMLVFAYDL